MGGTQLKGPSSSIRWLIWNAARILPPLLLLVFIACDKIILPPPPQPPDDLNPCDPNSSSFVEPGTVITFPADGAVVYQNSLQVRWRAESTKCPSLFKSSLDGGDFSSWSTATSRTLEYLDDSLPGESYTFEVWAAYDTTHSSLIQEMPTSVQFTVDAVQGPAFRLSPLYSEGSSSGYYDLDLIAEEVTDLMMIKAVVTYDPSLVTVQSWVLGDFITSNGGSPLSYDQTDNISGRFEINLSVVGATPEGVTGSGTLITIRFWGGGVGQAYIIFDNANTLMRNPDNVKITVSELVGAQIRLH